MDELTVVPLELPTQAERIYLEKFNLGAVAVFAGRANAPVTIIATSNLADALGAARRSWPRDDLPTLVVARWALMRAAQQVVSLALGNDLRTAGRAEGRLCVDAPTAVAAIDRAAVRLSVNLADHQTVLARARAGASAMGIQVAAAQASGALRDFNLRYKHARQQAEKENRRFPTYSMARARLVAAVAAWAASGSAVDFAKLFEETS